MHWTIPDLHCYLRLLGIRTYHFILSLVLQSETSSNKCIEQLLTYITLFILFHIPLHVCNPYSPSLTPVTFGHFPSVTLTALKVTTFSTSQVITFPFSLLTFHKWLKLITARRIQHTKPGLYRCPGPAPVLRKNIYSILFLCPNIASTFSAQTFTNV
jgi:hypothetical protein